MDHDLYDYSAMPTRARWCWKAPEAKGAGLAACAIVFLEHWEAEPMAGSLRDPRFVGEYGSFTPDYRSWTQREYGLRIGVFRVLDVLREAGVRPAIAANARVLARVPALVERLMNEGCEWIAHGVAATRLMHSRMPIDEQRAQVRESIEAIRRATGVAPTGWVAQDWGVTPQTATLLADEGLRYTLDWTNDDQPGWLKTTPPVVSIPMSAEWDDVQCQWFRNLEPRAHADLAIEAFERLASECARASRPAVYMLAIHPWVAGMPSRIAALRELFRCITSHDDVWWTRPSAIADAYAAVMPAPMQPAQQSPPGNERSF